MSEFDGEIHDRGLANREPFEGCHAPAGVPFEILKELLRASAKKNQNVSSTYRGVCLLKSNGKWHAQINMDAKQVNIHNSTLCVHVRPSMSFIEA